MKVWDVEREACTVTLGHHSDKAQSVAWNPVESSVLATAAFDGSMALVDMRAVASGASQEEAAARCPLPSDVESLAWYPHNPAVLVVRSSAHAAGWRPAAC